MNTIERNIHTAIVTGPTGAVGQAMCRYLLKKEIRVYAVCRPGSIRNQNIPKDKNLTNIVCDIKDIKIVTKLIDDRADAFFHLAWTNSAAKLRNNMMAQVDNIRTTVDACHAAKELDCKVFLGAGSQAEYGRVNHALTPETPCFPENGYGMAKLCAGQMSRVECEKLGLDHVWPRILSVYGPYDGENALISQLIKKLLNGERMPLTAGEQLWDYLYADDAAEALYRLALNGRSGAVYPVGSGRAKPLRQYLEILRDAIDPSLPLDFGAIPYGEKQVMHLEADLAALREDTGFEPKTGFETGIRNTIEHIRERIGK